MRAFAALASLACCASALAADPPPGPAKLATCVQCHGARGISVAPDAPHLAGQPKVYLAEQLKAFRAGRRIHPVMNVVAKDLRDADIEALSAWYASVAIEARGSR